MKGCRDDPENVSNIPAPISSLDKTSATISTDGATDAQALEAPMFFPKWKTNLQHVRETSRDDSGSIYSQTSRIIPDNASTTAVFSVAGVQKQEIVNARGSNSTPTPDNRSSTPLDQGGYDTPTSRRSVERLQRHQTDRTDAQSVNSSMLMSVNDSLLVRGEGMRSPSSMAIVHAEGVISSKVDSTADEVKSDRASSRTGYNGQAVDSTASSKANTHGRDQQDGETTPTTEKRPTLYDRQDTEFKTAHERL